MGNVQRFTTGAETLRVTAFNAAAGVVLTISGRRFDATSGISEFAHRLVPTTNRVATTFDVPLGEGWLLGLAIRVSAGTPLDGQTFVVAEIGAGQGGSFNALDVLIMDSVSAAKRAAWPGSPLRGPLDSAGAIRSIAGTTPAAGAEISETVPTGARWELLSIYVLLTTSATVINRNPMLIVDDGANSYYRMQQNANETASQAWSNVWAAGVPVWANAGQPGQVAGLPIGLRMTAGQRFRSLTSGIQVGDQYSALQYLVREWIEGA